MCCRLPWLFAAIFSVATPTASWAQPAASSPAAADKPAESQTHHWEFGTAIRAVGGPCAGLMGTFPVPIDWPEQQVKVASEQISPNVQRHSYRTADGLKQMVFEVPQL